MSYAHVTCRLCCIICMQQKASSDLNTVHAQQDAAWSTKNYAMLSDAMTLFVCMLCVYTIIAAISLW